MPGGVLSGEFAVFGTVGAKATSFTSGAEVFVCVFAESPASGTACCSALGATDGRVAVRKTPEDDRMKMATQAATATIITKSTIHGFPWGSWSFFLLLAAACWFVIVQPLVENKRRSVTNHLPRPTRPRASCSKDSCRRRPTPGVLTGSIVLGHRYRLQRRLYKNRIGRRVGKIMTASMFESRLKLMASISAIRCSHHRCEDCDKSSHSIVRIENRSSPHLDELSTFRTFVLIRGHGNDVFKES